MRRRLIAIGDLHGDVHRLVRILQRHEVFLPGTRKWAKAANTVDVVLLGDYVDWRGEKLEGDRATWDRGAADLLDLIADLHSQVDAHAASMRTAAPRFFSLLGNHDKLMLDSYRYLSSQPEARRKTLATAHTDVRALARELNEPVSIVSRVFGKKPAPAKDAECLLTWMSNGGPTTVKAYGGFDAWYGRMAGGVAALIEKKMPLGVVINNRLYSHSVPDTSTWWKPVDAIAGLPQNERDAAVDEWVWGRRIYGVDHKTGKPVPKPSDAEVDQMLARLGVKGVVVGHSLRQSLVPVKSYEGKVVNIDLHGHPMSDPWLEEYEA